ncbi:hypothetical protein RYH80_17590 [Halobaculum sp. MBLA0147]|uniref:DUF7269 family protein n=1 Tax=Halobaculum sp. MBLA0147 TaxID=3079934 RepID=UPI003525C510
MKPTRRVIRGLGYLLGRAVGGAVWLLRRLGRGEERLATRLRKVRTRESSGRLTTRLRGVQVAETDGSRRRRVVRAFDAVALLALVGAAATLAGVVPDAVVRTLAGVARPTLGVLGLLTAVLVLVTWNRSGTDADEPDHHEFGVPPHPAPPERVPAGDGVPPGARVALAAGEDDRIARATTRREFGGQSVEERLREAAVAAVVRDTGVDESVAAERVADGSWTDDPRAAALLADGEEPTVPPSEALRDWIAGERTPRTVRATVREIERRASPDEGGHGTRFAPGATSATDPTGTVRTADERTGTVETPGPETVGTDADNGRPADGVAETAVADPSLTGDDDGDTQTTASEVAGAEETAPPLRAGAGRGAFSWEVDR